MSIESVKPILTGNNRWEHQPSYFVRPALTCIFFNKFLIIFWTFYNFLWFVSFFSSFFFFWQRLRANKGGRLVIALIGQDRAQQPSLALGKDRDAPARGHKVARVAIGTLVISLARATLTYARVTRSLWLTRVSLRPLPTLSHRKRRKKILKERKKNHKNI